MNSPSSTASFTGLDPVLSSLGVLAGLLKKSGDNAFELEPDWFLDPFTNTKAGIVKNPQEFSTLFRELLGEIGGNAFGIPVQNPALLGNWYPISYEKDGVDHKTGVHAVIYQGDNNTTVFGLGVYHDWQFDSPATLEASVWGLIPFVAIDPNDTNSPIQITFVNEGYPIVIGAAVTGTDSANPLIDVNKIEFNGVKVNVNVDVAAKSPKSPFELGIEIVGLRLAGEDKPSNRSLSDLEAITAEQIMDTAASLFVGGLSNTFPDKADNIAYFPPLFGLSSRVPNADVTLPILKWYNLFQVIQDNTADALFFDWFNAIASDNKVLKTWLSCFSGFLFNNTEVSGDGSRNTPFEIPLLDVDNIGNLGLTLGSNVTGESTRYLYFGLNFAGNPIALGDSDIQFVMQADAEFASLQVTGNTPGLSAGIDFTAQFSLANKTAATPMASFKEGDKEYIIDSLEGGVTLGLDAKVMPWFGLNGVTIGEVHYETLNLLSPGQLAKAGSAALSAGLQGLLSTQTDNKKLSDNLGVLIGLQAPEGVAAKWPEELLPPFSEKGMEKSVKDPIGAWASYYSHALTYDAEIEGKQAFTYIVSAFATILKSATDTTAVAVTGSGTATDPWKAGISIEDKTLPAYLTGYQQTTENDVILTLGAELAPVITVAGTEVVASLELDAATIRFNKAQGFAGTTANWLSNVAARLTLPKGFETPAVGGMQVKVDAVQLSASWGQSGGWAWSMYVNGPALVIEGETASLGKNLNFDQQSSLEDLVKQTEATFGPFLVSALGTALIRSRSKASLALAGILGLVKDITKSPVYPNSGLAWSGFELYPFTSFSDPWGDLNNQIEQLFNTNEKGKSVLGLLAYAISDQEDGPEINGDGTFSQPWQTPIGNSHFTLPVWYARDKQNLGLGFGRAQAFEFAGPSDTKLNFSLDIRLNLIEYSTQKHQLDFVDPLPSLMCVGTLAGQTDTLVDLGEIGSLGSILLGFNLSLANGKVGFEPIVTLINAKLGTDPVRAQITLQDFSAKDFASNLQSAFLALLNGAVQEAVKLDSITQNSQFQTFYRLLELFGLALTRANNDSPYGINASGWNGLLADPTGYTANKVQTLLVVPDDRQKLFGFLEDVTGISIPPLPTPAKQFLAALNICGTQSQGYALLPEALMSLLSDPVNGFSSRVQALFSDAEAVKALATQISANLAPKKYGQFTFSTTSNGLVSFTVEEADAFELGELLKVFGGLVFNISDETLVLNIDISVPKVGLTLATSLSLQMSHGTLQPPVVSIQLIWGDGLKPAATPLDVYPFESEEFVNQVAALAPAYTLNALLNAVVEDQLLEKYALVQKLFKGLGIAKDDGGIWQMPSLLGILTDPLGWLLSDEVLGNNGRFSTAKLATILGDLPELQYNGIDIQPSVGKGIALSGLPFNVKVGITGENNLTNFDIGVDEIKVVDGLANLKNLSFAVSLDQDYQPAFTGGLDIEAIVESPELGFFTHLGYDKDFQLTVSQGTPEKPTGLGVQFLPFLGWGTIAEQALATGAAVVIEEVVPKLLKALKAKYPETSDAHKFFKAMESFGKDTDVKSLVKAITTTFTESIAQNLSGNEVLEKLEAAAFDWVKTRFTQDEAPNTADAVVTLLKLVLPETSLKAIDGRVQYIPSNTLPLTLLVGLNNHNAIGAWAGVSLPETDLFKVSVAPTGVSYNLTNEELDITFGVDAVVPIESVNGPGLRINYDNGDFNFSFDPLADPADLSKASNLSRQLLPEFFGGGDVEAKLTAWILDVIKYVLPRYVSLLVLNEEKVKSWLDATFSESTNITPIMLLQNTKVVSKVPGPYVLSSFDDLIKITPTAFLGNFLFTLLNTPWTLLEFGESGKIIIGPKNSQPTNKDFGLLIQAPDLTIKAIPNLVFQLGADNTQWIEKTSKDNKGAGAQFGQPGIGLYVPITHTDNSNDIDFEQFIFVLNNVGFDIVGKNNQPIVDFSRFKLGKVEPRTLFAMQFQPKDKPIELDFGAGLTLDEMGLTLAPQSISEGGGNNPIAKNVLGSGESSKEPSNNSGKDSETTDPRFSVDVAYREQLWVNLRSNTGSGHDVIVPVQRSFGPLYIENVGLGWEGEKTPPLLDFISSGSFELSGFKAALQGLRVGMPVTHPTDWSKYTIDLDGFAIDYSGGVDINVGFLKDETDNVVSYTGVGIVSSGKFSLGAIGSYAQIEIDDKESTSMFIFGVLNTPLGGVPAFFIEGVAAGFAYNRSLDIPSIEHVANFPLVKGVAEGSFTEGEDPMSALEKLKDVIHPQIGEYWFAAGLKFSSFKMVDTTALLFLSFGKDFEFNLLGVSIATLPPKSKPSLALAYMELGLKVTIAPAAGYVSAEAQLTPNSFILAKDVKLTGGFAFYLWFKNVPYKDTTIPAGDFVLTLGGYHPAFNKPEYYPDVPRLGINWKLDFSVGKVSITGVAYFALCPTAVMSGGYLTIAFNAGPLVAGLDAYANFLLQWQPFYFNVGIGVSVYAGFETSIAGVSVRLVAKLGCQLLLKGPPVFGGVKVDWYVISFTIPIGNQDNNPDKNVLHWDAFEKEFLPTNTSSEGNNNAMLKTARVAADGADTGQQVVKWTAQKGLQQDSNARPDNGVLSGAQTAEDNDQEWVLNPIPWQMTVESAIPTSELTVANSETTLTGSEDIGVRPMGKEDKLDSPMTVTLTDRAGNIINLKERNIALTNADNGAPSALWSRQKLNLDEAPDPDTMIIPGALFGLVLNANKYVYNGVVPEFPLANLEYVQGNTKRLPYAYTPNNKAAALYPNSDQKKAFTIIMQSIMSEDIITTRNAIYQALRASGINAPASPDLSVMTASANLILQDFPVLAKVGIYQNGGIPEAGTPIYGNTLSARSTAEFTVPQAPQVVARLQSYKSSANLTAPNPCIAQLQTRAKGNWRELDTMQREDQRITANARSMPKSHKLYDGTSLVWNIDCHQQAHLSLEGNLPVLASSFDKYGSLLSFECHQADTAIELPMKTKRVVLQGYEGELCNQVGWQIGTLLSKVTDGWKQGDGCLVRAQNSRHIDPRKGRIGHVKVSDLLDQNQVIMGSGDKDKGWLQTVFCAATKVVGVLLKGDVSPEVIQVTVAADAVPSKAQGSAPLAVKPYHGNTLILYRVPESVVSYSGTIVHQADKHTELLGMFGLGDCWLNSEQQHDSLKLSQVGLDFTLTTPKQTLVNILPG